MIKKLIRKLILWAISDSDIHFKNAQINTNIYFDEDGRQHANPSGHFKIVNNDLQHKR